MPQNNYSVVQSSFDEEETYLCVLPSSWVVKNGWNKRIPDKLTLLEGPDMCYWPAKAAGYRLLEKAKKIPSIRIDRTLLSAFRCKIKRSDFHTYNDACKEQKQMEMCSDTDEIVPKKRLKTDKSAADLFTEILAESQDAPPQMMRNISNAVADAGSVISESHEAERLNDDSFSSDFPPPRIENIHSKTKSSMQHIPQSRTQCTALEQDYTPLDVLSARVKNLENQMDRCLLMLSQISAKLDVIGSRNTADKDGEDQIEVMKYVLEPIRSLAELKAIEEKCIDDKFVESVICSMGKVHGKHRFTGAGQTVCLQLIDYFVDRRFLREVSWTGISKTKDQHGRPKAKIAFSKYNKFIDLFFQTILNADELFSLEACHKFLKQCIRNSKQRLEDVKQIRSSVSRKRCHRIARLTEDLEEDDGDLNDSHSNGLHTAQQLEDLMDSQGMIVEILEETTLKSEPVLHG